MGFASTSRTRQAWRRQGNGAAPETRSAPLHAAAASGDLKTVREQLDQGVDADRRTAVGETPLHCAAEASQVAMVQLLLEHRASPAAQDQHGDSALHLGVGSPGVTRALLRGGGGATVNAANGAGDTALHAAAWAGQGEVIELLLQAGASVDVAGRAGERPLAIAALRGQATAVACLLACGASIDAADATGSTALDAALTNEMTEVAALLKQRGARLTGASDAPLARIGAAVSPPPPPPPPPPNLGAAWAARCRRMPPAMQRVLVHGAPADGVAPTVLLLEGSTCNKLSKYRGACAALARPEAAALLRRRGALPCDACERLRRGVDVFGEVRTDSVDGLPNVDVGLSQGDLQTIVGAAAMRELLALPQAFHARAARAAHAVASNGAGAAAAPPPLPGGVRMVLTGCFARRYSADTARHDQPWTSLRRGRHFDNAHTTVNVALTADAEHEGGGALLGLYGGAVHSIRRAEGEATVHSSSLLHGVTRMRSGVRYSLIMFFAPATPTEAN